MTETRMDRMDRRDGALLRKVGDVIAAEPERYDQHHWAERAACGTRACLAGHAVTMVDGFEGYALDHHHPAHGLPARADDVRIDGQLYAIEEVAQEALGLVDGEWPLFDPGWLPAGDPATPLHERVRDALYALADGATVDEVTGQPAAGTGGRTLRQSITALDREES